MKGHKTKEETELVVTTKDGALHFGSVPKWKLEHIFHTSSRFMDYLHGDIEDGEPSIACYYEYARESRNSWEAAMRRDELIKEGRSAENAALWAAQEVCLQHDILPAWFTDFLCCASFPVKDWNELGQEERNQITRLCASGKTRPLRMTDAYSLKSLGVFDQFKAMGEAAKPAIEDVPPGGSGKPMKLVWPVLQQHESFYHVMFNLDFSKTPTQLMKEFRLWLDLPEYQELLNKYKKPTTGTTGKPLDRLKDLAAWRLFREMDNDVEAANAFANRHRKRRSTKPRAFYNARKQDGKPPTDADLFGEDSDARKAKKASLEFLADILPREFGPPPPFMVKIAQELKELASKKDQ